MRFSKFKNVVFWCILGSAAMMAANATATDVGNIQETVTEAVQSDTQSNDAVDTRELTAEEKIANARVAFADNISEFEKLIDELIKENRKQVREINLMERDAVRQADWYSKPWYDSLFVGASGSYVWGDSESSKGYTGGTYKNEHDAARAVMAGSYAVSAAASSGWINGTSGYNAAMSNYDYETSVLILPLITPPTVSTPESPNINVTPANVTFNVVSPSTFTIPPISVNPKVDDPKVTEPNANPYSEFTFENGDLEHLNVGEYNGTAPGNSQYWWAGYAIRTNTTTKKDEKVLVNDEGKSSTDTKTAGSTRAKNTNIYINGQEDTYSYNGQSVKGFYLHNIEVYAAGNGMTVSGKAKEGQIAIHTVWDGFLQDVKGYLGGKATFISIETWHGGKLTFDNVNVEVDGENNSIFYIYPSTYANIISTGMHSYNQRGSFTGKVDADLITSNNNIYVQSGYSGSFEIRSTGTYRLEAANNAVYSGLGYSANFEKLIGNSNGKIQIPTGQGTPSIQFIKEPEIYGDNNVLLFFNTKYNGILPGIYSNGGIVDSYANFSQSAPFIGIYQGEIYATAKIGEQLAINNSATEQTANGNVAGGDKTLVEGGIGIYSKSGQRAATGTQTGITPSSDLGAADFNADKIHNLEIGGINITFGKYSKSGIMLVSKLGTVIDVLGNTKTDYQVLGAGGSTDNKPSDKFTDGVSGADGNDSLASTGTIIAYAEGTWDNSYHHMPVGSDGKSSQTDFDGLGSEINIKIPLTMTSKEGIAFFAANDGIVTMSADVTATGYGSIIGYAEAGGKITVTEATAGTGKITVKDAGSITNNANKTYTNIGFAAVTKKKTENDGTTQGVEKGGTIEVAPNIDIHGLAGYANGSGSTVKLNGTSNQIETGEYGALVAQNGGVIEFGGGTIKHGRQTTNTTIDYSSTTPLYATSGGKINIKGATTIEISKGILFVGESHDYTATAGTATAYNGMENLSVKLIDNDVVIGLFKGYTGTDKITYASADSYFQELGTKVKMTSSKLDRNGKTFKSYLQDGELDITMANLNLDSDDFLSVITAENEMITISSATTVQSTSGKNIAIASNAGATSNTSTGVTNEGIVNISGGTTTPIGLYTSYGTITNKNQINVTAGIGAAGVNGSKLVNDTTGVITITNSVAGNIGVGLAGVRKNPSAAEGFGLDNGKTGDAVVIENDGKIEVQGTDGVGIYASANVNETTTHAINVKNTGTITVGDNGSGINVSNEHKVSSTVTLDNTSGNSKITTGDSATGVYAENTTIDVTTPYDIEIGDNSAAVYITKESTVKGTGTLKLNYRGTSGTGSAAAIMFDDSGASTNELDVDTTNITSTTGTVAAIYSKGSSSSSGTMTNKATLTLGDKVVGMVGTASKIINDTNGQINATTDDTVGMYVSDGGTAENKANITVKESSSGIYGKDSTITNSGTVTTGGTNSAGMYGKDKSKVELTATGVVNVGANSVGVAVETGTLNVAAGAHITAGESSTYVYTTNGTGTVEANLTLSKYSVGIYAKNAGSHLTNKGILKVGESDVTVDPVKVSVGMATEKGKITNEGTIDVIHPYGAGMVANDGGTAVNAAGGVINAKAKSTYGIQASNKSIARNYGTINVVGKGSRGIAASKDAKVYNELTGVINLIGDNTEGIYVQNGSVVYNYGTININNPTSKGIYIGQKSLKDDCHLNEGNIKGSGTPFLDYGGTVVNVGTITIDGPSVTIGGTLVNAGDIKIDGKLNFNDVKLNTSKYAGSISAEKYDEGNIIVLPQVTQGDNKKAYVVQYLQGSVLAPNNGALKAISQSVSFVADIQNDYDKDGINQLRIVLAKVPYEEMFAGTGAQAMGAGLDELYEAATGKELEMFDFFDSLSDKSALASYMETEVRGNVYANIQQRMIDIDEAFDAAYESLRHDRLYTKDSLKIGVIGTGVKREFDEYSVENYKTHTEGVMFLQEYDLRQYGEKWNWNAGFAHTTFDFYDTKNKEKVLSGNFGAHYERYVGYSTSLKYETRGDVSFGYHDTDRYIKLPVGTYHNDAQYWSGMVNWSNKLRYELPVNKPNMNAGIFAQMNLGYGKFEGAREDGDGMLLKLKSDDMYSVRPGVGADINYSKPVGKGKVAIYGRVTYEYEFGKEYDGPNSAKVKGTSAGYYDLEQPDNPEGILTAGVGVRYSSQCGHSVGVEVARQQGHLDSTRVGVNFMFRLGH